MRRVNCEMYPCHFPKQDCSLCFCPFYPCMDERTGGRIVEEGLWSCQDCTLVHCESISSMIMDELMAGESLSEVWKKAERLL